MVLPRAAGALAPPRSSSLPGSALALVLGLGSAARRVRVLHPTGEVHSCRVQVLGGARTWGARLLDEPAEHEGLVRVSRGLGLPAPLPDVLGLALRLPGLGVGGAPLDLLMNTSALRFAFWPDWLSRTYSAILPHRTGSGQRVVLGARPVEGGWELLVAEPLGAWAVWGRLDLGPVVETERIRFLPTVGADDLAPVELLRQVRHEAYLRSQAASAG